MKTITKTGRNQILVEKYKKEVAKTIKQQLLLGRLYL